MRTHWSHGPGRAWRASRLALSGGVVVLATGVLGVFGVIGAGPAQAWNDQGVLVPVFVVQPSTTQVNSPMSEVVVDVDYPNGQVDRQYHGPVVLEYAVNRLGAPLPGGSTATARWGVAAFHELTFSAVGFGFELVAEVPGQPGRPWSSSWSWPSGWNWTPGRGHGMRQPWSSQSGWNSMPGQGGGVSQPSAPFDIVGQLKTCLSEQTCQSETVSSGGTSGSAAADTQEGGGTLEATGGGFPSLSCTTVGGVVTFSSTLSKTITVSFAGSPGGYSWWQQKSVNVCWGSPTPFTTKFGFPARFNQANGEYEGLLPHCSAWRPAPCVSSVWFGPWGIKATIQAPVGDPHITF